MSIFLDSANLDDVRAAMVLGFVAGITTAEHPLSQQAIVEFEVAGRA